MPNTEIHIRSCRGALAAIAVAAVLAQAFAAHADTAATSGGFVDVHGIVNVNVAAGDQNLGLNSTSIAIGDGAAIAVVSAHQKMTIDVSASGSAAAFASIGNGAFAGAQGLIKVTHAAGNGNMLANATAIALSGGVALSDTVLGRTVTGQVTQFDLNQEFAGSATIDDTAFANAVGAVQVAVAAGPGNALANRLSLNVASGGN